MNREVYGYLNSARVLFFQVLRLKAKHDELESCLLPAAIRYDRDKVQTSPDDSMSKTVAEVMELEDRMKELQYLRAERIKDIDRAINSLSSDEERTVLSMRFINRVPVSDIAESMGYAEPTIYKFLKRGGEHIMETEEYKKYKNKYAIL